MKQKKRCAWVPEGNTLYEEYHDKEWGRPVHDERTHFEFLVLEGAQAGLSWNTILLRRENYRKAFDNFDPRKVAKYDAAKLETLMQDAGIIRNRLKIASAVNNAKLFLEVQKEFGSFDAYIWSFVGGEPLQNKRKSSKEIPAVTEESKTLSKDLLKRAL